MKAKSIVIRLESKEQLDMLSDEQCGKLLKALIVYADTGEVIKQNNQMLDFAFSFFKGQIDRDFMKYEETCKRRSESGKKGGAPKGNQNAARYDKNKQNNQMLEKQAKQPNPNPNPNNHTLVSVCECDCDARDARSNTAHTAQSNNVKTLEDALSLANSLGYSWTDKDAQEFLAYNIDKGRTTGWGYAAQRWEANRSRHDQSAGKDKAAAEEKASKYMCLVNRFKEDGNDG